LFIKVAINAIIAIAFMFFKYFYFGTVFNPVCYVRLQFFFLHRIAKTNSFSLKGKRNSIIEPEV
jgi:hypothetical protein